MHQENFDIQAIASQLSMSDQRIWCSKLNERVSYPKEGNDTCFAIEDESFWFKHRNHCIIEALKPLVKKNSIIFDVGGGNGFVSKGLEISDYTPFLVEPGIDGIKHARNRGLPHLVHSTFRDAGFKKNSVPNIGLFDVIEHI